MKQFKRIVRFVCTKENDSSFKSKAPDTKTQAERNSHQRVPKGTFLWALHLCTTESALSHPPANIPTPILLQLSWGWAATEVFFPQR